MATGAEKMWMALFVTFEKRRNPQRSLKAIHEDCALAFKKEERTVANAYRALKEVAEFRTEKLIDWFALMIAVCRAHP
jgi:hypothetical protein